MSDKYINLNIGSIDTDKLKTDDDLAREADRLFPMVLKSICEELAKESYVQLKKNGFVKSSPSEKRKYIKQESKNCQKSYSALEKRKLKKHIIDRLKDVRDSG